MVCHNHVSMRVQIRMEDERACSVQVDNGAELFIGGATWTRKQELLENHHYCTGCSVDMLYGLEKKKPNLITRAATITCCQGNQLG